jgi:tetratricopeptide (TPR) repeat protein
MIEHWPKLSGLMDACLDLRAGEREAYLRAATAGDPALTAQALAFLDQLAASTGFLDRPAPSPALPDDTPEGARFGPWQVTGILGSGGMGRVYAVSRVEGDFEQLGALKLIARGPSADRARFRTERQILADLDHPGLAKVLDGGLTADGDAWMVMERIDGQPIDAHCRAHALPLSARVRLVGDAAEAVAAAHAKLVLHRDLKPSNVLIDAAGRPKVIDFGIAKRMTANDQTEGPLPISAPYAAPELLTGAPAGPPTDVYGLAALLYELAAGTPPISLAGLPAALGLGRILDQTPAPLRQHRIDAPARLLADLEAVLAKALRKEPADRYPTLQAFAADLEAAVNGSGVSARQGERGYRLRRFLWRSRWPLAAGSAIAASLLLGAGLALWQARAATAARDAAVVEADRTEAVRQSLFLLLGEASEAAGPEGSRQDVLARAAARLTREFDRDPARYGPVMKALGELYFHTNDYPGAAALLTPIANRPTGLRPEIVAEAKVDLAEILIRMGNPQAARAHLQDAQQFWRSHPERWRTDLIDSRLAEAQLIRDLDKDPPRAAALLETALAERIAVSGAANRDVGIFQNNLGVTLQAMGNLPKAKAAFEQALATWRAIGAGESPDALNTLNNLAAIETLTGRPQAAQPLFAEAIRIRRDLFGPSAALAALLNNHAKVLLLLNQAPVALPQAQEAADMGQRFAGAGSLAHVSALAGVSEAHLKLGALKPGLAAGEEALRAAVAKSGPKSPPAAIAAIALARASAANGNRARARTLLFDAAIIVQAIGPPAARLAQAIDGIRRQYKLAD